MNAAVNMYPVITGALIVAGPNCIVQVNLAIGTTLIGAIWNWVIYSESVHLPKTVLNPS